MIGEIENAIIAFVKAPETQTFLGYIIPTVDTYPEDWESYVANDLINITPPAVFVTFGGFSPIDTGSSFSKVRATFGLILIARNYRNQKAARHGFGTGEVGSFQMAWDMAKILSSKDLGLPITGFEIGNCQYVVTTPEIEKSGISILALQLYTEITIEAAHFEGTLNDFETAQLGWDAPPPNQPNIINQTITLETGA